MPSSHGPGQGFQVSCKKGCGHVAGSLYPSQKPMREDCVNWLLKCPRPAKPRYSLVLKTQNNALGRRVCLNACGPPNRSSSANQEIRIKLFSQGWPVHSSKRVVFDSSGKTLVCREYLVVSPPEIVPDKLTSLFRYEHAAEVSMAARRLGRAQKECPWTIGFR